MTQHDTATSRTFLKVTLQFFRNGILRSGFKVKSEKVFEQL